MKFIKTFVIFSFLVNLIYFSFTQIDQQELDAFFRSFQNGELEDFFDLKGQESNEFLDKLIEGYGLEPNKINRYLFLQTLAKYFDDYKYSINKEEKYEELFNGLTTSFEKLTNEAELLGSKRIDKKDSRFFKKRYLAVLLGLFAFIGINIGVYFKWFNWSKENEQKLTDLNSELEKNKADYLAEHERLTEQLSEKLKQGETSLSSKINKRVDECEKKVEKLNKKIEVVSKEKVEKMAGEYRRDVSALQDRIAVMCDKKVEQVRKECKNDIEECKKDMRTFERGVVDVLEKNKKEMDQTKLGIGKVAEGIEQHCKEVEKSIQQNSGKEEKGFWNDLFSVNMEASDGIKALEKMISLTNGVEKVAKLFAGEDKNSEDQLRERLDRLHLNLPSVPRTDPVRV